MLDSAPSPFPEARGTKREIVPRAQALAANDDHLFPPLRLAPIPGETGIENMLRQIAALTHSPVAPLLLPARPQKDRQLPGKAPSSRPAAKRAARQAMARWRWAELARFGSTLAAACILACGTLYPSNGQLAKGWKLPGLDALAGPRAAGVVAASANPTVTQGSGSDSPAGVPQAAALAQAPAPVAALPALRPPARPSSVAVVAIPPLAAAPPPAATATPAALPAPAASPPAPPEKAAATIAQPAKPALVGEADGASAALLLARGNELLAAGDIVSARQFFSRAAESGAATAAAAMAKTYDPLFLGQIGAVGVRPDAARAVEWYRQAAKSGDVTATGRIERLANDIGAGSSVPRPQVPLR
jgi:hypothetical protein